jgi:hypothetical protein
MSEKANRPLALERAWKRCSRVTTVLAVAVVPVMMSRPLSIETDVTERPGAIV